MTGRSTEEIFEIGFADDGTVSMFANMLREVGFRESCRTGKANNHVHVFDDTINLQELLVIYRQNAQGR